MQTYLRVNNVHKLRDGFDGDVQLVGYCFLRQAVINQPQYFPLPVSQNGFGYISPHRITLSPTGGIGICATITITRTLPETTLPAGGQTMRTAKSGASASLAIPASSVKIEMVKRCFIGPQRSHTHPVEASAVEYWATAEKGLALPAFPFKRIAKNALFVRLMVIVVALVTTLTAFV